jgi:4-alpha-glucanotransferase
MARKFFKLSNTFLYMNCKPKFKRQSGVLMHPSSLPGPHGIGSLGRQARDFVDFLAQAGASIWQILPLGPTGYGDSPYQCFSAFAGNPYLIDIEALRDRGWLVESDFSAELFPDDVVDFGRVIPYKMALLRRAFSRSRSSQLPGFDGFIAAESPWLNDYSLFMAIKEAHGGGSWLDWPAEIRHREAGLLAQYRLELKDEIDFQIFLQYIFFSQWYALKDYAHSKNVSLLGDIPLYVALDSSDVWANPECFDLDRSYVPRVVAGVPPDYFSATGQLWGNPIYNWERMQSDGFSWWKDRIAANLKLYDLLRIDHFRGLEAYWAVPYGEDTAVNGVWVKAPGMQLLDALKNHFGDLPLIAEDLGVITDEVNAIRDAHSLPGMKILQFAFDSLEGNNHSPHLYEPNTIVYTGTHDNDTMMGWVDKASDEDIRSLLDYLGISNSTSLNWHLIRLAYSSVASMAIIPVQDILGLSSEARMNLPGSMGGNWTWRMLKDSLSETHAAKLAHLARLFDRNTSKQ